MRTWERCICRNLSSPGSRDWIVATAFPNQHWPRSQTWGQLNCHQLKGLDVDINTRKWKHKRWTNSPSKPKSGRSRCCVLRWGVVRVVAWTIIAHVLLSNKSKNTYLRDLHRGAGRPQKMRGEERQGRGRGRWRQAERPIRTLNNNWNSRSRPFLLMIDARFWAVPTFCVRTEDLWGEFKTLAEARGDPEEELGTWRHLRAIWFLLEDNVLPFFCLKISHDDTSTEKFCNKINWLFGYITIPKFVFISGSLTWPLLLPTTLRTRLPRRPTAWTAGPTTTARGWGREGGCSAQCAVCKVYFSAQLNKLRPNLSFKKYYPIQHIIVPACSSARKIHFF